ncbi:hypothetical protein GCM10010435_46510 [Winogradskya consettensis]|uniref:Uncharacterized protein n=1 Tax=Winogradskya consettensis TaxID=113560 RepID=A0A919T3N2_9ACTN|nr:hypothetical protein [Actinoplanes consettensis]GIM83090.1 hypothetical protein Aco04nite_84890 [Actinoplanes consettensis]
MSTNTWQSPRPTTAMHGSELSTFGSTTRPVIPLQTVLSRAVLRSTVSATFFAACAAGNREAGGK